jgi:hypothetical protein
MSFPIPAEGTGFPKRRPNAMGYLMLLLLRLFWRVEPDVIDING